MINLAEIRGNSRAEMLRKEEEKGETIRISRNISTIENSELLNVKGIGEATAIELMSQGINKVEDLANVDISKLKINPIAKKAIEKFIKN